MQVILVNKNFPFYENLNDRKSYISIKNGIIYDDKATMLKNQSNYMKNFFPENEENISNKTNIKIKDDFTRIITGLSVSNYPPSTYPGDFNF